MTKSRKKGPVGRVDPFAVYDIEGAANAVGMKSRTVQKYIREGKIVAQRGGREYRITGENLLEYLGSATYRGAERLGKMIDTRGVPPQK